MPSQGEQISKKREKCIKDVLFSRCRKVSSQPWQPNLIYNICLEVQRDSTQCTMDR